MEEANVLGDFLRAQRALGLYLLLAAETEWRTMILQRVHFGVGDERWGVDERTPKIRVRQSLTGYTVAA